MLAPASFPTRHQVNKSLLPSGRCRTVAVTVRLRPPNESELNGGERRAVFVGGDGTVAKVKVPGTVSRIRSVGSLETSPTNADGGGGETMRFEYDSVLDARSTQDDAYWAAAGPALGSFLSSAPDPDQAAQGGGARWGVVGSGSGTGRSSAYLLLAYGGRGSGKTHTVFGSTRGLDRCNIPAAEDECSSAGEVAAIEDQDDGTCVSSLGSTGASHIPPPPLFNPSMSSMAPPRVLDLRPSSSSANPSQRPLATPQENMIGMAANSQGILKKSLFSKEDSKSSSVSGTASGTRTDLPRGAGIVPRLVWEVLNHASAEGGGKMRLSCSCVAVYLESTVDLLATAPGNRSGGRSVRALKVSDGSAGVADGALLGARERPCRSMADLVSILEDANEFRKSARGTMRIGELAILD